MKVIEMKYNWPSYRLRAAEKISYHIGRLYRGIQVRQQILYFRWRKYNTAAHIIQRSYRNSKNRKSSYAIEARIHRLRMLHQPKVKSNDSIKSLNLLMLGEGSYEDRMVLWRLIIDLRRAFPQHSIETCVKSVVESRGDTHRAMTLLGLPAFSSRQHDNLPKLFKSIFLPALCQPEVRPSSSSRSRDPASTSSHNSGIKAIRHLKRTSSRTRLVACSDLEKDIARLLDAIYCSKYIGGNTVIPSKFKRVYAPSTTNDHQNVTITQTKIKASSLSMQKN